MLRVLGMILVVAASSAVGFGYAAAVRAQAMQLQQLAGALTYMKHEITCRLTPLPELFSMLGRTSGKVVGAFFTCCAGILLDSPASGMQSVFCQALRQTPQLALNQTSRQTLVELAASLGRFDAEGQCGAIDLAAARLRQQLQTLEANRRERCRSYETIGVCAGLALAVILL